MNTDNFSLLVFLRTLEYYPGILFLTTNRPGVFDEAVKSRVHISLDYPAFSLEQTLKLFKMNIERLEEIEKVRFKAQRASQGPEPAKQMTIRTDEIMKFAKKHYNGSDEALRWNGRQIRNAFQIAASLARFQQQQQQQQQQKELLSEEETGTNKTAPPPYIGKKHFKQVAQATADFDRMRREVLGASDRELASQRMERATNTHPDDGPNQAGWDEPPRTRNKGSDTRNDRRGHSGRHHHRGAPVQEQSHYYDDDARRRNGAPQFDDRYELDSSYRGGGYGGSSSVGRPSRRDKHSHRNRSPYEGDGSDGDRDYRDGRHARRAESVGSDSTSRSVALSQSSVSTSRSRSSSQSEDEARHQVRDANTKSGDSIRTSGRRSGQKSGTGGDSNKYSRRRVE